MSLFGDQLRSFAQSMDIRMDKIVRKVTLDMIRDLVLGTPVDTGHARSNWYPAMERAQDLDPAMSTNGAPSIQRAASFAETLKAGGIFYIVNNVAYIMRLEYGSSNQAPAGMARITVARWQAIVDGAVGAL